MVLTIRVDRKALRRGGMANRGRSVVSQCHQVPAGQPQRVVLVDVAASDGLARKAVLAGTLAPEVGNMTALRVLSLSGNAFSVRVAAASPRIVC